MSAPNASAASTSRAPAAAIVRVGDAGAKAGAALDRHLGAERDEFLHRFRARRDARLARIGFRDDPNQHDAIPRRFASPERRREPDDFH